MTKPSEDKIACEVCLKEIPASEASSDEASDYVAHFCGLECHEIWRRQQAENESGPETDKE